MSVAMGTDDEDNELCGPTCWTKSAEAIDTTLRPMHAASRLLRCIANLAAERSSLRQGHHAHPLCDVRVFSKIIREIWNVTQNTSSSQPRGPPRAALTSSVGVPT